MINRFEALLEKYELFPTANKWSDDRKLRLIWKACSKYKALQMKVEMIKSEYTSRCRPPERLTCPYITSELIGQWLSFAGDDGQKSGIFTMDTAPDRSHTSEDKRYKDLTQQISTLTTAVGQMVELNIAHAQAAKDVGAGKVGGARIMTQCQKQDCTNESPAPPHRKCHLCKECYDSFVKDKDQTSIPLKNGKTMSKGPEQERASGYKYHPLKIESYHVQPTTVLQEFAHDFSGHQNSDGHQYADVLNIEVGKQQDEIPYDTFL